MTTLLRLHAVVSCTTALGPGRRAGIWVQGCAQRCRGCFNPGTHDPEGGDAESVDQLAQWVRRRRPLYQLEGVTISGGEPMEQPEAVFELLKAMRFLGLGVVLYSGWELSRILLDGRALQMLQFVDLLTCGPFEMDKVCGGMRGSLNRELLYITGRYSPKMVDAVPEFEVVLGRDGSITWVGGKGVASCLTTGR